MIRTPYAQRQLEGEAEYVTALVKSQLATMWVSLILASAVSAGAISVGVVALTAAKNHRVTQDGAQGDQGIPGANGVDGRNGTDGLNGADGVAGLDGVNGSQAAIELRLDEFRGARAFDATTMRVYDDTPYLSSIIVMGPSNGSVLAVAAAGAMVGTTTHTANVALEIHQSLGALLLPRFTTAQRTALTVPAGSAVFDTTLSTVCVFTGSLWYSISMTALP